MKSISSSTFLFMLKTIKHKGETCNRNQRNRAKEKVSNNDHKKHLHGVASTPPPTNDESWRQSDPSSTDCSPTLAYPDFAMSFLDWRNWD